MRPFHQPAIADELSDSAIEQRGFAGRGMGLMILHVAVEHQLGIGRTVDVMKCAAADRLLQGDDCAPGFGDGSISSVCCGLKQGCLSRSRSAGDDEQPLASMDHADASLIVWGKRGELHASDT